MDDDTLLKEAQEQVRDEVAQGMNIQQDYADVLALQWASQNFVHELAWAWHQTHVTPETERRGWQYCPDPLCQRAFRFMPLPMAQIGG